MSDRINHEELSETYWGRRYQEGRTGWDRGQPSPALVDFIAELGTNNARILVPGCGSGHEVIALAEQGFSVTALDFAEEPVSRVRAGLLNANLEAQVIQADALGAEFDEPFDAVYEQTCLCALHPEHWQAYVQKLFDWLKPGGLLFALFMQSHQPGGPPFHCDMEIMGDLFETDRWQWAPNLIDYDHPSGLKEIAAIIRRC